MASHEADRRYERDETLTQQLDRNWNEMLQEVRVTQTGTQILTGFLLTLAFQPRFTELDTFQRSLYLVLVSLTAVSTVLGLLPVTLHRVLFRQRAKDRIVHASNVVMLLSLIGVALTLAGTVLLVFDVVLSRTAAFVALGVVLVIVLLSWVVLPAMLRRGGQRGTGSASSGTD